MGVLISTSLITAFLAGLAALLAPCCISVLLPTYLASIFRQKKKVFFMTFVFFFGILVVFLPLGLGFGGLGKLFTQLHDFIFGFGALFLIVLAFSTVLGFHPRFPFQVNPKLENENVPSVFMLGIFSGLATTCCTPVLAGVLVLSVLPGSMFWGGMYALTYTLGMVIPLFITALLLDKINLTERVSLLNKTFHFRRLGKERLVTLSNLVSSLMFLTTGILILVLDITGNLSMESALLIRANFFIAQFVNSLSATWKNIPGFVFVLLALILFATILMIALKQVRATQNINKTGR